MLPQVKSGDYVLLLTWPVITLWPGMQVVFDHPLYGTLLKKVVNIERKQKIFSTQGLNPVSISAVNLRNIPLSCLKGIVIWHVPKKISSSSTPRHEH